jgi:hypothetical protein
MINKKMKLTSLILLVYLMFVINLSACDKIRVKRDNQPQTSSKSNDTSLKKNNELISYQGSLYDIDELVNYYEVIQSDQNLYHQRVQDAKSKINKTKEEGWNESAKGFVMSIDLIPTNDGIISYAKSQILTNVHTFTPQETLSTKVRNFKEAIQLYNIAKEFAQRTNQPLSLEQKKEIEVNIDCLEIFIKNPNPKNIPCPLVAEALKISQIIN